MVTHEEGSRIISTREGNYFHVRRGSFAQEEMSVAPEEEELSPQEEMSVAPEEEGSSPQEEVSVAPVEEGIISTREGVCCTCGGGDHLHKRRCLLHLRKRDHLHKRKCLLHLWRRDHLHKRRCLFRLWWRDHLHKRRNQLFPPEEGMARLVAECIGLTI